MSILIKKPGPLHYLFDHFAHHDQFDQNDQFYRVMVIDKFINADQIDQNPFKRERVVQTPAPLLCGSTTF